MVVVFQCTDPYIASRNREDTCIAYEDSRAWEIMTIKEARETYGFKRLTSRNRA